MASTRDLRRRIKSVKNTQKITKAMKMVAASKLRHAQESVISARPFAKQIQEVLGRVSSATTDVVHPLLEVREVNKIAYIIVTADSGLCGGLNANIIKKLSVEMVPGSEVIAVGKKGRDYFKKRNYDVTAEYVGLGDNIAFTEAKAIASNIIKGYSEGKFDEVHLYFSRFKSALTQIPSDIKLLPMEQPEGNAAESSGPQALYLFEPNAEAILNELLPKYVETIIYRALLESKASEFGARMTAMGSATDNAHELIAKLTLNLNRARQAAITTEITEIVGGAAALE